MIDRYSLPEMAGGVVRHDHDSTDGWRSSCSPPRPRPQLGVVPPDDAAACRDRAPVVDEAFVDAVTERERTTDHDVAAFVDVVQAAIGPPAGSWIHHGLTASDVVDTALCWAMRDAGRLLIDAADRLVATVVSLARRHRSTVMIGRTHGIHAEPTTFGAKAALWALAARS